MLIRNYNPNTDYEAVKALLLDSSTYGGEFDEARDAKERINNLEVSKPGSVLVAEVDGRIIGTVSLFEDGRFAWLYRFAVEHGQDDAIAALWQQAKAAMRARGHTQVLVYAPAGDKGFETRYNNLGFNTGGDYTAYWQDIN